MHTEASASGRAGAAGQTRPRLLSTKESSLPQDLKIPIIIPINTRHCLIYPSVRKNLESKAVFSLCAMKYSASMAPQPPGKHLMVAPS